MPSADVCDPSDGLPPNSLLLSTLRRLLEGLPSKLPAVEYSFKSFSVRAESVEDRGLVGAVNHELEVTSQTHVKGCRFLFSGRGAGLEAVADVLEKYLGQFPGDSILRKWADDLIESTKLAFKAHGEEEELVKMGKGGNSEGQGETDAAEVEEEPEDEVDWDAV
ncbi:hypothetical protein BOTBODRAFT_170486 [Botryobasidium botryosum FD-172 SS1]|uniref:Uncharacterized protein n=1 Tax=Botryobasidium botryosum (strain FD-172 SS1) TaxID=930990 RepID=A0A067MXH7_BOTB1|nr:hypothetical protein BOTBODRAFT_170486 [Botryobasidium botryosum FD-172 SS1]